MNEHDAAMVAAFGDFLEHPTSRCPICLGDDHTRPSQCPEVTDAERRRYGVMGMDVASASQVARIGQRR